MMADAPQTNAVGFPRIDRYFPECMCAAIEAVARHRFGVHNFGKIYGYHSFRYTKENGPIRFRSNGVQLDLEIHRDLIPDGTLEGAIADIYGVRAEPRRFEDTQNHRSFCAAELRAGDALPIDFDLKFIKERREYGKVDNPHIIVLFDHDPATGTFTAAEQMIGTIQISAEDFERCIAEKIERAGFAEVWQVRNSGDSERSLRRDEVLAQIARNLANLTGSSPHLGLLALDRFCADITEYIRSPDFSAPFSVPGLWVFSHERHITRKWLSSVRLLCSDAAQPVIDQLDASCEQLFKHWLAADYLIEKCLAANSGRALRSFPAYLGKIQAEERRATESWAELHQLMTAG